MQIRTYFELSRYQTFEERYEYLRLGGAIGEETFGFDRFMNQKFYKSREWRDIRDFVIVRDHGCDLGVLGHDIIGRILIHHMNPLSIKDLETNSEFLLEPNYLIATSHATHNAIHYGDKSLLQSEPVERFLNDTCPWKNV